jgi:plasmid stabilization system protein ParE
MTYRFLAEARADFDAAVDWYDAQRPGLGDDFTDEAYATIRRIVAQPHAFAPVARVPRGREIRFLGVDRFDYIVVYEVLAAEVVVVSVYHTRRRPSWRGRL